MGGLLPRGSKGNVKYWSKYSSRRKDSKYEDELRVSGIFFPSTRIEASDSCYLQKPLGDTQCARMDLNKRFLPKPMTTTG